MVACRYFPVVVLRTPAFSYEQYVPGELKKFLRDPFFQQALLLASTSLYAELEKTGFAYDQLNKKERAALLKYLNRMCFRPTPFGLFSAFSAAEWLAGGELTLGSQIAHVQKSFASVIRTAQKQKGTLIPEHLPYRANQTHYKCGNELRYLACFPNEENKGFEFSIRSISSHRILQRVFAFCTKKRTFESIRNFLMQAAGTTDQDAAQLLNELIGIQALTDGNTPNITGRDHTQRIHSQEQRESLQSFSAAGDDYVNLEKAVSGALNAAYQAPVLEGIECLYWLNAAGSPGRNNLQHFIHDYGQKFEGRVMPLLYVLDPGVGTGYKNLAQQEEKSELLSNIDWDKHAQTPHSISWSATHALLLSKWKNMHPASFTKVISLSAEDIAILKEGITGVILPPTFSAVFRVMDNQVIIESVGGATANALIGRFTPFNERIQELGICIAKKEICHNPDVIFAEIAHICDFHTANINRRENLYPYEIPVLTGSVVPDARQIPLSDLWVSVVNGEVILQSKKLNKRVIPRLSSAFNHIRNNLSVFRFLCDLQYQAVPSALGLDLNIYFPGLDYYPRVEYKKAILTLATWRVFRKQWQSILDPADPEERIRRFKALKKNLHLPQWIAITVHDHQLVFNLSKRDHTDFFLQVIKDQDQIIIKEFLQAGEKKAAVTDPFNRPVINQFVASLYHEQQVYKGQISPFPETAGELFRKIPPGADWLYFKIYCHPSTQNELLATTLSSIVKNLLKRNIIHEWFFVRYTDPDPHIRFRLKVCTGNIHPAFRFSCQVLNREIKQQTVRHYAIAVYERELERYGVVTMPFFEQTFFSSSNAVLTYLHALGSEGINLTLEDRAFMDAYTILDCFGFAEEKAVNFLRSLSEGFITEFAHPDLKYQLDIKYRTLEKRINLVLTPGREISDAPGVQVVQHAFIASLKSLFINIRGENPAQIAKWTSDLMHMHLNRLFTVDARRQELVVYYCLFKYEKSLLARKQKSTLGGACAV